MSAPSPCGHDTTWLDLAHKVAAIHGVMLTDAEANLLLWEHTGFPGFWRTDKPHRECVAQLHAFFVEEYAA